MRRFTLLLALVCCQAAHGQSSILIEADAPGYGPRETAQAVLAPLENYLDGTDGVRRMRGLALDGKCFIRLELTADADRQLVGMTVQNRVTLAKTALPGLCTTKILPQADGAFMLVSLEQGSDTSLADVSKSVRQTVWPRLASVPGVADIHLIGAAEPGVRVTLDPLKLQARNLAAGDIVAALQASRKRFDGLSFQGKKVTLKEERGTPAYLGDIPIHAEQRVYLRDVAVVKEADELRQDARVFHGGGKGFLMRRAVFVLVQMPPGKLRAVAQQGAEKAVAVLRSKLPPGMHLEARLLQQSDTTVAMRLPDGLGEGRWIDKAEAAVKAMMETPGVRRVDWIARPDAREVIFYVLADAGKQADLQKSLRTKLARIDATKSRVGGLVSPLFAWPGQGSQFVVRLMGKDLEKLRNTAELLGTRLAKSPGIVDVDHFPKQRQELAVTIDRERMALAGVQPADVADAVRSEDQPILGWPWPVTLSVPRGQVQSAEELGLLPIRFHEGKAATLLRDVATIKMVAAPNGVLHEDGRPCVIVFGNIEGQTLDEAGAAIRRLAEELAGKGIGAEVECPAGKISYQAPPQPGPAGKKQQKPPAAGPTPVSTAMPRRITLTRRIEQPGTLQAFESTPIYSKITGFAMDVRVDIGDHVKKDELLVKLFIPEQMHELKVKETSVKQAEADLLLAKENVLAAKAAEDAAKARIAEAEAKVERWLAEVARAKKLLKDGKSDQAAVDQCVNRWKVSTAAKAACDADWREKGAVRSARQASVQVAEAHLQVSTQSYLRWKALVSYAELRAPYDGIITQRNVHTGDFVQPSGSTSKRAEPLFVIKRIDIMRVVVQVPELDAVAVKKGDKAIFSPQALPGVDLIGAVTRHSFALDVNNRSLRVECDVPNADKKLRPGMYVRAVIAGKIDNAWVLPEAAIVHDILADGDIQYCFQVVEGKARRLNVEVGLFGEEGREVLRKREPGSKQWVNLSGQEVIVTNPAGLVDGRAVMPRAAEPKKKE